MSKLNPVPPLLKDPRLFERITLDELDKKIVGEIETRQTLFLSMCGAVYVKNATIGAYNLMPNNRSGAGKDHVALNTLRIFPSKFWEFQTRISPKALTYWKANDKDWTWDGKVLYLSDISQDVLNSEVLKVMLTEGSKAVIATGEGKVKEFEVKGKPSVILTTAEGTPNIEMLRRVPIINLDEGIDQTEAILERQAEMLASGDGMEYDRDIKHALAWLAPAEVVIPYAPILLQVFHSRHIIMRTHFGRLASYIMASAALHQHQRDRDEKNRVIATGEDYDIARIAVVKMTQNEYMIPTSRKQEQILKVAQEQVDVDGNPLWFAIPEVKHRLPMAKGTMYRHFDVLSETFFETRVTHPDGSVGGRPRTEYRLKPQVSVEIPPWSRVIEQTETTEKTRITRKTEQTSEKASTAPNQVSSVSSVISVVFAVTDLHKQGHEFLTPHMIAAHIGASEDEVLAELRRLEQEGEVVEQKPTQWRATA